MNDFDFVKHDDGYLVNQDLVTEIGYIKRWGRCGWECQDTDGNFIAYMNGTMQEAATIIAQRTGHYIKEES